ncbi:hypothetical protein [Aquicoccus sp. SU-CL01552]|uniref:hypothetical protein n=1 Tax=Aquicoccus sp. SU-CL01552 TaxID=3127656 RepID=UPI00310BDEAD
MSFIRPEVRTALARWHEALIGLAAVALGLYWALSVGGLMGWIGWLMVPAGAGLAVIGIQRGRFRSTGRGPGVVLVDEGEITYMGPLSGGSVSVMDLERLVLDPTTRPAHWGLEQPGHPMLQIPVNAEGAQDLFDVFAALPGLRTERMLAELKRDNAHAVVIWERRPMRPAHQRLH